MNVFSCDIITYYLPACLPRLLCWDDNDESGTSNDGNTALIVELGKASHDNGIAKMMMELSKKKVQKKMLFLRNKRLAQPRIIRLRADPSYYTDKERAFVYDQNRKELFGVSFG